MVGVSSLKIQRIIPMLIVIPILIRTVAVGETIHVDVSGQADFDYVQAGIDAADDGDTVLVAPGEYVITEPITFRGKAITVISEAGQNETTVRMGTPADTNRGSVVVFENNETAASILDGFTITGGKGSRLPSVNALVGGGIYFNASSGTVRNCAIVQNTAKHGGGVFCAYQCAPRLIDCVIGENLASGSRSGGGGVFLWFRASMTLTNCIIKGNSTGSGGGIFCYHSSSLIMTDCIITGNTAQYGGGVKCEYGLSATLTHCIITGNTSRTWGGGLEVVYGSATVTNCTIARNTAAGTGGGLWCGDGSATVTNSIFWGNTARRGSEIALEVTSVLDITCSDVAGGEACVYDDGSSTLNWGVGNIDAAPLFAEPGYWADINDPNIIVEPDDPNAVWIDGDYHLKSEAGRWTSASSVELDPNSDSWVVDNVTSPCIDRGDPNSPVGDEPMPNGGIINMGAYGGTPEASMSTGLLPPLPPSPLAQWKLDEAEGVIVYSTSYNYGILYGNPTWQPDGGQVAGALEFDGIDDFISTDFVLDPSFGAFSTFVWVKGGAPGQVIISQSDGTGTGNTWLGQDAQEGTLMTGLVPPSTGWTTKKPLVSESIISDGQWHHIGFVWDGSYRILYADGIEVVKDTTAQNPLKSATGGLYIGASKDLDAASFFSGLIDDVRIYNVALSAEQIVALTQ